MSAFDQLEPIDLGTLDSMWAFQTRTDRKYVLDAEVLPDLAHDLEPGTRVLDIDGRTEFGYQSVYFDTPDLRSYRDTLHRRRRRFKVRTRIYLDSSLMRLEVKAKNGRGQTVKHRTHKSGNAMVLTPNERGFLDRHVGDLETVKQLRPTLVNTYRRTTLALPDLGGRVTVDSGLAFWTPDEVPWFADHIAIVETKSGPKPTSVDHWLWRHSIRPTRMSKYCTSLAVLRPELPANKWHRVISRYFQDSRPFGVPSPAVATNA